MNPTRIVHSNGFPPALPFPYSFPVTTAASPLHRATHSASRRPAPVLDQIRFRKTMTLRDYTPTATVQISALE
jgi:hypothetical protein